MLPMDDGARIWLLREVRRQYWRVATWYEIDDLVQDGLLHYHRVATKYAHVKDRPHIMRLFQITFINHVHDLSKRKGKQIDLPISTYISNPLSENTILDRVGTEDSMNLALFKASLAKAPKPVIDVINLLTTEYGRRCLCAQMRVYTNGVRETLNDRLCRLCNYDPKVTDLVGTVRSYLMDQDEQIAA
jgi:hypothetical protein